MKSLMLFAAVAAVAAGLPVNVEFEIFKVQYAKEYETQQEHDDRQLVFEKNLQYIEKHNQEAAKGIHTYILGVNSFADLTIEEFAAQRNGFNASQSIDSQENLYIPPEVKALPKAVDWRKKGYVTEVKNQAQCGSCWAFSAIGSIEGQHFNATKKLVSLSEQNIVDCDSTSMGCFGGLMLNAFKYVLKNKGVDTEASYPYEAEDEKCHYKPSNVGATIKSYRQIESQHEDALTIAAATVGPISVAIDANHQSFQLYKAGVYSEKRCSKDQLDHGVLVVGYGTLPSKHGQAGHEYWLVKNSWGTSWGQQGYIMMKRGSNECGIATQASFPLA